MPLERPKVHTYADMGAVAVVVNVSVVGNRLAPFGATFELYVVDIDTADKQTGEPREKWNMGMGTRVSRINDIDVDAFATLCLIAILVKRAERKRLPMGKSRKALPNRNGQQKRLKSGQGPEHTQGAPFSVSDAQTRESRST
jgi:hypothetical protein